MAANDRSISLPSWYLTEKDTASTIQKLTGIQELVFYLENPDAFIRRLAIIRTGQLKRKESYTLLMGILEDKLETEENHRLAAHLMSRLNDELNLGFFVNHPYLAGFPNSEETDDYLNIRIIDTLPDIKLNFEGSLIESQLNFDNEFIKSNIDESYAVTPFSLNDWLHHVSARFLLNLKKGIRNISSILFTSLFIKGPKLIFSFLASLPKRIATRKEAPVKSNIGKPVKILRVKSVTYTRKRPETYRLPLGLKIKGLIRGMLNVVFMPFRVLFRLKWVILIFLVTIYGLLSFTTPGKSLLFRIYPQAYYLNNQFLSHAEEYAKNLIQSNETLAGFLGRGDTASPQPTIETTQSREALKKMVVTASKGLYLRTEPKSSGNRLVLMKQNTTVEFLGEEKSDGAGGLWYKVRLDNATGWANAQFLKEV